MFEGQLYPLLEALRSCLAQEQLYLSEVSEQALEVTLTVIQPQKQACLNIIRGFLNDDPDYPMSQEEISLIKTCFELNQLNHALVTMAYTHTEAVMAHLSAAPAVKLYSSEGRL